MNKTAIAIGGFLCGLMHALMSKHLSPRQGHDAGIMLDENVFAVLEKFVPGYHKHDFGVDVQGPQFFLDREGCPRWKFEARKTCTSWGLLAGMLRGEFEKEPERVKGMVNGVADSDYKSGARVIGIEDLGEKVRLRYEDVVSKSVETLEADQVIAADGPNSSVRKMIMPDVKG
ncbi:hypothetical protein BCR34DRAFT_101521 [Clohesyomyces aquaticus]|uniref:FAD-binding domain-containing protein n=1 Tax=Clohesyomyces aquaticus TaxID=1231657 RepID=A0A1Y1YSR9_9PLEO|nr:hypothetical protein BCR34DRAFT_101521 [Clohesyomyces aquaticus]